MAFCPLHVLWIRIVNSIWLSVETSSIVPDSAHRGGGKPQNKLHSVFICTRREIRRYYINARVVRGAQQKSVKQHEQPLQLARMGVWISYSSWAVDCSFVKDPEGTL